MDDGWLQEGVKERDRHFGDFDASMYYTSPSLYIAVSLRVCIAGVGGQI